MKPIILFCTVLILLMAGCRKEDKTTENSGLPGKWKLKEQYWSPGDKGAWHAVETSQQSIIEFHSDSTFSFTSNFEKANLELNKFLLAGDELHMSSTQNSNTDKWYITYIDNKRLELSIVRCIEGCISRFVATR